jgi:predicted 3-demethylubiquinone-9 3-methyltransferase (glyoxalase superfamily)
MDGNDAMTQVATAQKIAPFLWFEDGKAKEAAEFYVSIFKDSKIEKVTDYGEAGPGPAGSPMMVEFQLEGQAFKAINAPSDSAPDPDVDSFHRGGIALYVDCETQSEVDRLWDKLSEGGEHLPCGWVKDKFGFAWNIVPAGIGNYLGGDDPKGSQRAMQAMLQMQKLDIDELKRAYEGK